MRSMLVHHPVPARRPAQTARHALGFTAIELLIVITILAVLTALAGPSFGPLIERWRTNQAVNNMTSTLYAARSEAIKRGGKVSVRKIANGTEGCTFASTNQEWSCGWVIFVDADVSNGNVQRTQETINCYILTMDLSRLKPEYVCITDEQVEFLNEVIKSKNPQNKVNPQPSF